MALVRCSCVADLARDDGGRTRLDVLVVDPDCAYVVHRLGALLAPATAERDEPLPDSCL